MLINTNKDLKSKLIKNSRKARFNNSFLGKALLWFKRQRWQIKYSLLIIFIFVVFLSGLFGVYKFQQVQAVHQLKQEFSSEVLKKKKINHNAKGRTYIKDVKVVTPKSLIQLHNKAIELGYEKSLMGKLTIPSIKLKDLPVYQGMNKYTLALGAATYYPKDRIYRKGNFILAAHNTTPEKFMFTNLGKIKVGDVVKFNDDIGIYSYRVDNVRYNVNPYQATVNGKPIVGSIFYNNTDKRYLTLFTCQDEAGDTRTVVTAVYQNVKF